MCIEGTDYILIEMPYKIWNQNDIEDLYELTLTGVKPVIAHIDRYFRHFGEAVYQIFELDLCFQLNAKVMSSIIGRRFVKELMASGRTCVIGSDMHNNLSRPCNIAKAYKIASKKFPDFCETIFGANAFKILYS